MRATIVSDNAKLDQEVTNILQRSGYNCRVTAPTPFSGVVEQLARDRPELIVVILSPEPEAPLAVLHALKGCAPGVVLAIGPVAMPKLPARTMREGVNHFVFEEDLHEAMEVILARVLAAPPAEGAAGERGQIIAVCCPCVGCGTSTVAANLAAVFAQSSRRCALIDLKLGAGDQAALFNVKPVHTVAELCSSAEQLDRMMLEQSLVAHESGVHVLAPTKVMSEIKEVTAAGVARILTLARASFPYVVVDLDDFFHPEQLQTIRLADVLLLLFCLKFTALRHARRTLDFLDDQGIAADKIRLVVNRYGQPQEIPAKRAEETLGLPIFHYLPDDAKAVNRANNNGVPAVLEAPRASFSKGILELARSLSRTTPR